MPDDHPNSLAHWVNAYRVGTWLKQQAKEQGVDPKGVTTKSWLTSLSGREGVCVLCVVCVCVCVCHH